MGKAFLLFAGLAFGFAAYAGGSEKSLGEVTSLEWSSASQSPVWHRLMHYRRVAPFGKLKSEIDGPEFFFAADGKTNPEAELRASAEAFASSREIGALHQPVQCAFPERFRFVKSALGLAYKEVPCPALEQFLAKFDADSLTLVFSAGQSDSPATMFGHTFFRINSRKKERSELLDQGLSYAAVAPPDDGPLVFYFLGMTGGYHGHFLMMPYYLKVNEYTNSESRDLWEYKLSLTREETERLLRHAWEIETTSWMNYYFFDGNCASALMSLLEVARPDWDLTPFSLYVIPGESVKRVARIPGAVTQVTYRPSLKKKLMRKLDELSASGRDEFYAVIHGEADPASVTSAAVLDAAGTYFLFEKQKRDGKLPADLHFRMMQVLSRRSALTSALPQAKPSDEVPAEKAPTTRPDAGHDQVQLGLGGGSARYGSGRGSPTLFQELNIRSAYHDLMNDDEGFTRFSQIEFPSLALRYYPAPETLEIDRLTVLSIVSLFPVSRIEFKPSWQLQLEYFAPKDASCDDCHAFHLQGGSGVTGAIFSPDVLGSLMVLADWQAGNWQSGWQDRWLRAGPGAQSRVIMNPAAGGYKMQLVASVLTDLLPTDAPGRSLIRYELEWGHSLKLGEQWDARLTYDSIFHGSGTRPYYDETLLSINHYF